MFVFPLIATLITTASLEPGPIVIAPLEAEAPVLKIGKDSDMELHFDWAGKAIDGTDVDLNGAEFIFRPPAAGLPVPPPIRVLWTTPILIGTNRYTVKTLLVDVPPEVYEITVRVRSDAGEWSEVSNTLKREIVAKKPQAPTNFQDVGR